MNNSRLFPHEAFYLAIMKSLAFLRACHQSSSIFKTQIYSIPGSRRTEEAKEVRSVAYIESVASMERLFDLSGSIVLVIGFSIKHDIPNICHAIWYNTERILAFYALIMMLLFQVTANIFFSNTAEWSNSGKSRTQKAF